MIDVHAHVLPGVDDGPTTWEEALEMVRLASEDGIRAVVATSHMMPDGPFANTRDVLLPLADELGRRAAAAGIDVDIYPGGEVYMTPDVDERLARGELLTYGDGGRYMLLEMPSGEIPRYAPDVLFHLRVEGITPIIAHPERNHDIMRDASRASELLTHGALLQVNASSLDSRHGRVRQAARYMLEHGFVHFLATDAHGVRSRRPRLQAFVDMAGERIGDEAARRLVQTNPAAVLAGDTIRSEPIRPAEGGEGKNRRRGAWLGRLLRRSRFR